MFPRGGGSVLTPLEQKQIQLEAKADALREGEFDTEEKTKHKKEKRRKSKLGAFEDTKKKSSSDEDGTKIEALNYKRLAKGSVVLGQVSAISHHNLTIALPNNLSGNVSIAAISDVVTAKIQQAAEASDDDDDSADEGDDDDDIELNSLFEVGQYVRAYVLSTKEGEGSGKKNHIELSLRPEDANSGMSKNDVVANATVMAAVTSVQDHGYEMELGTS
ncbi:rRNA biogenesis protein rrp5 like [Verticillium longisporum]|nr:rRNA biogenesis protein rrp5 like [Verticillium longisporum]